MSAAEALTAARSAGIRITIDGAAVTVPEGSTLLEACRTRGIDTPTLCYLETLAPVNACRVCVVEMEGSRTLVPSCSRKVEANLVVRTDSERVRLSRRLVLELLGSSRHGDVIAYASGLAMVRRLSRAFLGSRADDVREFRHLVEWQTRSLDLLAYTRRDASMAAQADVLRTLLGAIDEGGS